MPLNSGKLQTITLNSGKLQTISVEFDKRDNANNYKTLHKNMEPEDFIITKVGWITQMKSTPPLTEEYIQRVYLRFEIMIRFLQNHKFTTRIILNDGDSVNDETGIKHSDLTAEGSPEKAIRDISFLEKKKVEFENL